MQIEKDKVEEKNKIITEMQDLKNRIELLQKDLEKGISPEYTEFQMYQSYAMANKMEEAQSIIRSQYYRNKNNKDYTIAFNKI